MRPCVTLALVARARWLSPFASRSRFTRRPVADGAIRIEFYSPGQGTDAPTIERPHRRPLDGERGRLLPGRAGSRHEGVLLAGHEERAAPAIRVLDQREVVPLAVHARHHVADSPTRPR